MAYPAETVLVRKDSKNDPFDHISVVGVSPISTSRVGGWAGETGNDVICQPVDEFVAPQQIPESVLNREYEVESMPEVVTETVIDPRRARTRLPQLAPEDQLRQQAAEAEAQVEKPKRGRARTAIGDDGDF